MIDRVPTIDAQPFLEGALPGAVDKGMEVARAFVRPRLPRGRKNHSDFRGRVAFDDVKFRTREAGDAV